MHKNHSRVCMITACPLPLFNTTQLKRRELECKVFLSVSWSISISLCVWEHTLTHSSNPSIPLPHHDGLKTHSTFFFYFSVSDLLVSFYFCLYQCPFSLSLSFSLVIKTLITFSFRSSDFNTYYHGPIKYCSLHPKIWAHYYFTWSPRGRRHTQTHIYTGFYIIINQLNKGSVEKLTSPSKLGNASYFAYLPCVWM